VAEAMIAVGERAEDAGGQVAVIPGELALAVDIGAVDAIPGQAGADAIGIGPDPAIAITRGDICRAMAVMGVDAADQPAALALGEEAVDTGPDAPVVEIVPCAARADMRIEPAACTLDLDPCAAAVDLCPGAATLVVAVVAGPLRRYRAKVILRRILADDGGDRGRSLRLAPVTVADALL